MPRANHSYFSAHPLPNGCPDHSAQIAKGLEVRLRMDDCGNANKQVIDQIQILLPGAKSHQVMGLSRDGACLKGEFAEFSGTDKFHVPLTLLVPAKAAPG